MSPPVVVVTREPRAGDPLCAALRSGGVRVVALPTVATEPPLDAAPLDAALRDLAGFDWLAFTSARAVEAVSARPSWPSQRPFPARPRVAAVGRATAERAREEGLQPALLPDLAGGRGLAQALRAASGPTGRRPRVLWPRSEIAHRELADGLADWGAVLVDPVAYRTLPVSPARLAERIRALEQGRIDAVAFLSPSSARALAAALGRAGLGSLRGRAALASLGPTTSAALRALGAPPDIEAADRSAESLAMALLSHLCSTRGAAR